LFKGPWGGGGEEYKKGQVRGVFEAEGGGRGGMGDVQVDEWVRGRFSGCKGGGREVDVGPECFRSLEW